MLFPGSVVIQALHRTNTDQLISDFSLGIYQFISLYQYMAPFAFIEKGVFHILIRYSTDVIKRIPGLTTVQYVQVMEGVIYRLSRCFLHFISRGTVT